MTFFPVTFFPAEGLEPSVENRHGNTWVIGEEYFHIKGCDARV